jgi:hypothetical protein
VPEGAHLSKGVGALVGGRRQRLHVAQVEVVHAGWRGRERREEARRAAGAVDQLVIVDMQ